MNDAALNLVRRCLARVRPDANAEDLDARTPLLEDRILRSFDIVELLLELEAETGRRVAREQLVPGSFRDLATIAQVFVSGRSPQP